MLPLEEDLGRYVYANGRRTRPDSDAQLSSKVDGCGPLTSKTDPLEHLDGAQVAYFMLPKPESLRLPTGRTFTFTASEAAHERLSWVADQGADLSSHTTLDARRACPGAQSLSAPGNDLSEAKSPAM